MPYGKDITPDELHYGDDKYYIAAPGLQVPWPWALPKPWLRVSEVRCVFCGELGRCDRYGLTVRAPSGWHVSRQTGALYCFFCIGESEQELVDHYAWFDAVHGENDFIEFLERQEVKLTNVHVFAHEEFERMGRKLTVKNIKENSMASKNVEVEEVVVAENRVKAQMREIGGAVKAGAQLAVVDAGGEVFIDMVKELAKDVPALEGLLKTEEGRELAKLIVAFSIHSLASHSPIVPKADAVKWVAERQITAATLHLIAPRMQSMMKYFEKLAGLGAQLQENYEAPPVQARVDAEQEVSVEPVKTKTNGARAHK